jgi:hypothetical protein
MPNESEGPILVFDNSVLALNLAFAQVLERLDAGRGLRGASQIYDRTSVGGPVAQADAVRLQDLPSERPSNALYHILSQRASFTGPVVRPVSLTNNTGGVVSNILAAVGGLVALTDSSGGVADDTIAAITQVANVGSADLAPVQNAIADLAAKVNALIADLTDTQNALASLASKVNEILVQLTDAGVMN